AWFPGACVRLLLGVRWSRRGGAPAAGTVGRRRAVVAGRPQPGRVAGAGSAAAQSAAAGAAGGLPGFTAARQWHRTLVVRARLGPGAGTQQRAAARWPAGLAGQG